MQLLACCSAECKCLKFATFWLAVNGHATVTRIHILLKPKIIVTLKLVDFNSAFWSYNHSHFMYNAALCCS